MVHLDLWGEVGISRGPTVRPLTKERGTFFSGDLRSLAFSLWGNPETADDYVLYKAGRKIQVFSKPRCTDDFRLFFKFF